MATVVRLFAVQDQVAAVFHPPFPGQTEGVALRQCVQWMRLEGHPYNQHPGDYYLWEVGEYDESGGMISGIVPRRVCNLQELVKTEG